MSYTDIILGFITVIGTVFGLVSCLDARKSRKDLEKYSYLFDQAEKHIDKNLTLEELNRLHKEKQEMDQVIKKEIPKQARIAVLYDRLKADEEYLSASYNRYIQTKNEYINLNEEIRVEIPQKILTEIENQILPEYVIKQKKQKNMSLLTIISCSMAVFASIPVLNEFSRFFALAILYPLVKLFMLSMPKDKQERRKYILTLLYNSIFTISFLATLGTGYLLPLDRRLGIELEIPFLFSATIFMFFLLQKLIYVVLKKETEKKN